jgi:ATP synthase protein I
LMQTDPRHSGDLSHDSALPAAHQMVVPALTKRVFASPARSDAQRRAVSIDPAARTARGAYRNLSSASVGLELGLSVLIGLGIGMYLDRQAGTGPWLMLLFLCFGFVAGFRGVLRAVRREDRHAEEAARG